MLEVPILIVGGGPVGLTASMLLSLHSVHSLLVERHPGTATLPKARGINERTMEMYRQMGVEAAIREAGMPPKFGGMIVWSESLDGAEINRIKPGRGAAASLAVSQPPIAAARRTTLSRCRGATQRQHRPMACASTPN